VITFSKFSLVSSTVAMGRLCAQFPNWRAV